MADWYIRQGDTLPSIYGFLRDANGDVPDLTLADGAVFRMRHKNSGALMVNDATATLIKETGRWQYDWAEGDTVRAGEHHAVVKVISGDKAQTFPSKANIIIEVEADLSDDA
jgi:hypothetical protein